MNNFDRQDMPSSACEENGVTRMDAYRPHFCIDTDEGVHVVPLSLVEDWAAGKIEPHPAVVRKIIKEWLQVFLDKGDTNE